MVSILLHGMFLALLAGVNVWVGMGLLGRWDFNAAGFNFGVALFATLGSIYCLVRAARE